jgi:hypothetical protein
MILGILFTMSIFSFAVDHWLEIFGALILIEQNRILIRQNRIMERETQVRLHVVPTGVYDLRNQSGVIEGVGVHVRNQSAFPVLVRDVGFRVNGTYLDLGLPEGVGPNEGSSKNWKVEIPSRNSRTFFLATGHFPRFFKRYEALDPKRPNQNIEHLFARWRAYAATECGEVLLSRLDKPTLPWLYGLLKQKLRDTWDSWTWRVGGGIKLR